MISDSEAKALHDRATRSMQHLSEQEQASLAAWYHHEDAAETRLLRIGDAPAPRATLHAQIDAALAQLATSVQRIQEAAAENERIRGEITELRHQLADSVLAQVA